MTFSIVAFSPGEPSWGVGVATRYLAVGAMVPAAEAGVGAIATQSWTNMSFRSAGLSLLRTGADAKSVVTALVNGDQERDKRQVGVVDRDGVAATFTGTRCEPFAGSRTGEGYAIQGNLVTGPEVLSAMEQAWLDSDPARPLADRLLAALTAGESAGGDRRGRQSAALYVVTPGGAVGYGSDVAVDLRVDDSPHPLTELARLLGLHHDLVADS